MGVKKGLILVGYNTLLQIPRPPCELGNLTSRFKLANKVEFLAFKIFKHPKNWETALWGKERLY